MPNTLAKRQDIEARVEKMLSDLRASLIPTRDFVIVMNARDYESIGSPKTLANRPVKSYHMIEEGNLYALPKELWRRRWREEWQYDSLIQEREHEKLKEQRET